MTRDFSVRSAREEELKEVVALMLECFGGEAHYFENIITQDVWRDPENTLVGTVEGRIVTALQVHYRPIAYGKAQLIMGGIGHVCTLESYRRRGYSSALLEAAIGLMERKGYHLSLLFTGLHRHYQRHGWVTVPVEYYGVNLRQYARAFASEAGWDIRPYREPEDVPALIEVYQADSQERIGPLLRIPEYWEKQPSWTRGTYLTEDIAGSRVAIKEGRIVAYAKYRDRLWQPQQAAIIELCTLPECPEAAIALFDVVAQYALSIGKERLLFAVPRGHPLLEKLVQRGVPVDKHTNSSGMWRLNTLKGTLQAILPELEVRAEKAELLEPFALRMQVGEEQVCLSGGRGEMAIQEKEGGAPIVLSAPQFLTLLLGEWKPTDYKEAAGDYASLLAALFPPTGHIYWFADHF